MEFEQLRLLVEQLPAVVWATDEALTVTAIGGAALKALGVSAPMNAAAPHLPALFDEFTPIILAHRRALAGAGSSYPVEWKGRTFQCHVRPLQDPSGQTIGTIGLGLDVTEGVAAERAIRERDMRFQLVARATNDAVWDWDIVTDTVWRNEAPASLFGYEGDIPPEVGWWLERLHPDDAARVTRTSEAAIQGSGQTWAEEYRFRRADGTYADIFDRGYIVRTTAGEAVRMIGAMVDISARKQAQAAVEKSESQYRSLIQNATYGIYRSTVDGRFLEVNPALAAMLGYDSAEELMAHDNMTAIYADPDERLRLIEQYAGTGRIDGVEVGWKRKDGAPITVRLSGRIVEDAQAGVRGFEVIAEDVTARRGLEEQLRQAQKIEAVGRLAGGIAHDFNNLLTAIFGFSDLALDQLQADHPARPEVQEVRKAAQTAASLTRQLLAFSRKQVLQPRVLNLNETVERMQALLQRVIGEHIGLVTRPAPSLHPVFADPGQLEQVVMNLAINARDAMPNGGQLTIETANVRFETVDLARKRGAQGDFVRVTIADTGIGMDDTVRSRLFDPFFTTKERGRGTGLGLATVYGVVRQSGGFIWVDSAPGQGTTFTLDFPRAPATVTSGDERREPIAVAGAGETILLVEDLPAVRGVMRELLARNGYQVLEADGGEMALQLADSAGRPIDLLLTDVIMPKMSGRELARRLVARLPQVRVLYTSGYTDDLIAHHGVLEEGVSFLQKPFTQHHLLQKLREVLDQPRSSSIA